MLFSILRLWPGGVAVVALLICASAAGSAASPPMPELYFVDAHSQMARGLDEGIILPLMNAAGVRRVILSARNDREPKDVANFAKKYPDRTTAAVRSKGNAFNRNHPMFKTLLGKQLDNPTFKAMAEVILFHAQKGSKAPAINVSVDSPQSQAVLEAARNRGWPCILHYEFAAAGLGKSALMKEMEAEVSAHPEHPYALIHMAQLDAKDAARLIAAHKNLYFITSHSNPITIAENPGQPWARLFDGNGLAADWKALFLKHPDRFILAFDNVFPEHWGRMFVEQAKLWRKALSALPSEVAHAIAHGNAERLWKLEAR